MAIAKKKTRRVSKHRRKTKKRRVGSARLSRPSPRRPGDLQWVDRPRKMIHNPAWPTDPSPPPAPPPPPAADGPPPPTPAQQSQNPRKRLDTFED